MRTAADRAKALKRVAAVQADMVKLAEAKLATARLGLERSLDDIARLSAFVADDAALGPGLALSAARTAKTLAARRFAAEREVSIATEALHEGKRRDHAVTNRAREAGIAAKREVEAKALDELMEAWLARTASLPQG